jgi:hypothetical protein
MKRETYVWALIIIAIMSVALYIRFFYQPPMNIALGISNSAPAQFYPFQKATLQVTAYNNGSSAISNMSLGVNVNGNLTTLYKVTLPAGKQATINFNYSPSKPGIYEISVVADPGKLYNIVNRANSQANFTLDVANSEKAKPSSLFPEQNITAFQEENLTNGGYIVATHIADQYNISGLALTDNYQLNRFIKPVINITASLIRNISIAQAKYADGSEEYSIWIKGFIVPRIFSVATLGSSLSTTNIETNAGNTTFVKLLNGTTFCSWYSGGWTKILAELGGRSCYILLNATSPNATPLKPAGLGSNFSKKLVIKDSKWLADYNGTSGNGDYMGRIWLVSNISFIYLRASNASGVRNTTCYGIMGMINGTSYCSTYLYPASHQIGSFSLVRTTAYKGAYNLTALSLVNTSLVTTQVPVAEGILNRINVSGMSLEFKSGFVNTCSFNDSFVCSNLTYLNGTITFRLTNNISKPVRFNSINCYQTAGVLPFPLNFSLGSGASKNITTQCYSLTTKISGLVIGLHLGLALNYTASNSTRVVIGSASIPFG